ncbi:PH and SEC7 domain-containing protein 4-like [Thomomys bottae]
MMGDNRLSDQPQPMEFLNMHLGDDLQPCPGACWRDTCSQPDPTEPCREQTWPLDPSESTGHSAPHSGSGLETAHFESCSSHGEPVQASGSPGALGSSQTLDCPRQSQSSSTQVVFWAGILQAQMCVLDLEEELEKTEGLRAELRCCIPPPPPDSSSNVELSSSPPVEEDFREDSSASEGENQAWPREDVAGSSLEWGAEEESVFFDNPLFLESPCSDTSVAGECFSWELPDSHTNMRTRPNSPQTLESPRPGCTVSWKPGSESDLEGSRTNSSGHTTPPFPVPPYKSHPSCWPSQAAVERASTASSGEEEDEVSLFQEISPGPFWGHCREGPSWGPLGSEHSLMTF